MARSCVVSYPAHPSASVLCGVACAMVLLLTGGVASAQEAGVTITGGADDTGHNYTWRVANKSTVPIVSVVFPQYMADLFTAPADWTTESTNLRGLGGGPGECTATAADPDRGIAPGKEAIFTLRVAPKGARRGKGEVAVSFADGRQVRVTAQVPTQEPFVERHIPLIGLGVMFALFLAYQARKSRKQQLANVPDEQTNDHPPPS